MPELDPDEGDVPLSEAGGVHKRAHLLDEGPARGQQEPSITRRNRGEQAQFPLRAPSAFPSVLGAPQMCDPSRPSASFRHMASEAQKGVLARCARLRRPDEPTEPVARRRNRRANPLRPLRKPYFTSEPRVLVNERAASRGRAPFGTRQDRHVDFIAGRDRQEMGEDARTARIKSLSRSPTLANLVKIASRQATMPLEPRCATAHPKPISKSS